MNFSWGNPYFDDPRVATILQMQTSSDAFIFVLFLFHH
jgi:hypothetical protein